MASLLQPNLLDIITRDQLVQIAQSLGGPRLTRRQELLDWIRQYLDGEPLVYQGGSYFRLSDFASRYSAARTIEGTAGPLRIEEINGEPEIPRIGYEPLDAEHLARIDQDAQQVVEEGLQVDPRMDLDVSMEEFVPDDHDGIEELSEAVSMELEPYDQFQLINLTDRLINQYFGRYARTRIEPIQDFLLFLAQSIRESDLPVRVRQVYPRALVGEPRTWSAYRYLDFVLRTLQDHLEYSVSTEMAREGPRRRIRELMERANEYIHRYYSQVRDDIRSSYG